MLPGRTGLQGEGKESSIPGSRGAGSALHPACHSTGTPCGIGGPQTHWDTHLPETGSLQAAPGAGGSAPPGRPGGRAGLAPGARPPTASAPGPGGRGQPGQSHPGGAVTARSALFQWTVTARSEASQGMGDSGVRATTPERVTAGFEPSRRDNWARQVGAIPRDGDSRVRSIPEDSEIGAVPGAGGQRDQSHPLGKGSSWVKAGSPRGTGTSRVGAVPRNVGHPRQPHPLGKANRRLGATGAAP